MRKGRLTGTLSRNSRPIDHYLAGHDFDGATLDAALRWGNHIEAAVQRHMVGKISSERRRIDKRTAAIMLGQELARLTLNRAGNDAEASSKNLGTKGNRHD